MKEADIRPQETFDEYLRLLGEDIERFFSDHATFVAVPCPGCGAAPVDAAFVKSGFSYVECPVCETLWTSPRPRACRLDEFYSASRSAKYWATDFYRRTAEARRQHIFAPRAELVAQLAHDHGCAGVVADIGCGYGIFLQELAARGCFSEVVGVEPNPDLAAVSRHCGFRVLETPVEGVPAGALRVDIATAFEVLEHVFDPLTFLSSLRAVLKPGGLVVLTTLTVSGFDIQTLWERSNAVSPPQHLNLLSIEGMQRLMERAGLKIIQLSTPGRLDVDIVENAYRRDSSIPIPRFLKYMFASRDEATRAEFQAFLAKALLSSHVRVVAGLA